MFLGLVINVVIFILLFICIVLIYSLLVTNVESRTFEIGIIRMVGATRLEVIGLLLFQALSYSVLSYPIGLGIGTSSKFFHDNHSSKHVPVCFRSD